MWGPGSTGTANTGCRGAVYFGSSIDNGLTIGPSKGNFLAMDGALRDTAGVHLRGQISQTITGLTPGVPVTVEFEWAAGQQAGFREPNTEQLQVSLCPTSGTFRRRHRCCSVVLPCDRNSRGGIGHCGTAVRFARRKRPLGPCARTGYLDGSWSQLTLYRRLRLSAPQIGLCSGQSRGRVTSRDTGQL